MNVIKRNLQKFLGAVLVVALLSLVVSAQQNRANLRGLVVDEFGGALVGATVTLIDQAGAQKNTTSNADGVYTFAALAPGKYYIQAAAKGFATSDPVEVEVTAGQRQSLDITLKVTIEEQKVTVAAETPLSTEATNNANQTLITGKDLDALPDDPDEMAAALQALAGPSVGPNGGQIFIDGFSGGRLPPKESIREIRINQNPFAAENDQPSGRIDILTRPGTDKIRGSTFFNFEDESLNSRNPFSVTRTPYQVRQYGGNLSGPLVKKKASFFIDFQRRETDDNELVTATVLDSNLNRQFLGFGVVAPRRNTTFSPRFDYQINTNNTLIVRYSYSHNNSDNSGVGGFSLPSRAYTNSNTQHNFQITETAVLNASMINETRFQFTRNDGESLGDNTVPVLNVSGAFIGGGSAVGHLLNINNSWELTNFTAWQKGSHAIKFGGRVRGVKISDNNPNNFGGTYTFAGAFVPILDANNNPINNQPVFVDSLERYRRTLLGQQLGRTPNEIRAMGGGSSQFNINSGDPQAGVRQVDMGVYLQDDWRVKPNLTFSYGLRYENQTNTHSPLNFAPRVAIAWSPGAANATRPPNMVIRAGGGVFYNRFNESNTLQANRYNTTGTQQFFISEIPLYLCQRNPGVDPTVPCVSGPGGTGTLVFQPPLPTPLDAFPALPSTAGLSLVGRQITWKVDPGLQTPTVYLGGVQVERQLPKRFTMFVGFYTIHIQHVIRARDLNAPLPGTITDQNRNGIRPFGNIGEIYQYESSGNFDQNQVFVGFNNRFSRTLTFSGNYSLSKTQNDTDGQGGSLFPVNSYDLTGEYGRALFDVRHRFNFFGNLSLPHQISLSPFISISSGRPFNITTGQDTNGDRILNERPSFAPAGVDCAHPTANIKCTPFGNFNLNPNSGEPLIPRNFGEGTGYFSVNLRVSKTWSFGAVTNNNRAAAGQGQQPASQGQTAQAQSGQGQGTDGKRTQTAEGSGGNRGGRGAGGSPNGGMPRIPGGGGGPGGGGPGGGGGGGGGGVRGGGGGGGGFTPAGAGGEVKRYSLNLSINFSNLFNNVNLTPPVGNLSSASFGQSLGLQGSFGGFGGGFGSSGAGNRRITASLRFSF
jgi:hypothetical protein